MIDNTQVDVPLDPPGSTQELSPEIRESTQGPSCQDHTTTHKQCVAQEDDIPLTQKWKKTLPFVDQGWISKTFFHYATIGPQFDFNRVTKLWYEPPQPSISKGVLNKQECFFGHRLFLWMPRHLFQYHFICPHSGCQGTLVNNGVHQKTRMVLDVNDFYIIAGEDYECSRCKRRASAMWATNVGNEHGQVLMSVLTECEGEGLRKMYDGITSRYRNAGVPPPKVLYTDRDCCGRQGVRLYTQVSTVKKGGIELPVYKCARGYTSLENFHLHMARFIPGKLANDTNFQVYLLDGILDEMQIGLLRLSLVPANKQQMFQGLVCIVLMCSSGLRFVQLSLATEQIPGLRIFLSHAYNSDCVLVIHHLKID